MNTDKRKRYEELAARFPNVDEVEETELDSLREQLGIPDPFAAENPEYYPELAGDQLALLAGMLATARSLNDGDPAYANAEYVRGQAELIIDTVEGLGMDQDKDGLIAAIAGGAAFKVRVTEVREI